MKGRITGDSAGPEALSRDYRFGPISAHLFVISLNNSGSTLLARALARAPGGAGLPREGQHVSGFTGPSSRSTGTRRLWAAHPKAVALFRNPALFDWDRTRRAWQFHARSRSPGPSVLAVSSPPFVLYADALAAAFPEARFVFLMRDPYAVIEGICRRPDPGPLPPGEDRRRVAALHVITAMAFQRDNIQTLQDRSVLIRYEDMCTDPDPAARRIAALAPALGAVDLRDGATAGQVSLVNRNAVQTARLSADDIVNINAVLDSHTDLLAHFGYDRRPL